MAKKQEMMKFIRFFLEKTGKTEYTMQEVADYAMSLGWAPPVQKEPRELLAERFAQAAREETRKDPKTGHSYRANLAVITRTSSGQMTLWADADDAPRPFAQKSFIQRRDQIVDDAVQLTFDVMHWNGINAGEVPIQIPLDFTQDVEWRLNGSDVNDKAA